MTADVDRYSVTPYGRRWAVLDLLETDGRPQVYLHEDQARQTAEHLNQHDRAARTPSPPQPEQTELFNDRQEVAR